MPIDKKPQGLRQGSPPDFPDVQGVFLEASKAFIHLQAPSGKAGSLMRSITHNKRLNASSTPLSTRARGVCIGASQAAHHRSCQLEASESSEVRCSVGCVMENVR